MGGRLLVHLDFLRPLCSDDGEDPSATWVSESHEKAHAEDVVPAMIHQRVGEVNGFRFADRLTRKERLQLAQLLQQIPRVANLGGPDLGRLFAALSDAACFARAGVPRPRQVRGQPPKIEAHILAFDVQRVLARCGLPAGLWIYDPKSKKPPMKSPAHQVLAAVGPLAGLRISRDPRHIFRQARKIHQSD